MPNDRIGKVMGHVKYVGKDKDGNIIYEHEHDLEKGEHNTVCDLYYDIIADHMAGGTDVLITHGHAGTGSGQGATDTNLAVYCAEARTAIDSKTQGGAGSDHIVTVIFTLGAGVCTDNLQECGLFSNSAQATADMKLYDDTLSYNKPAGGTLEVTWTITHSN
jgi:hypothetical protein